MMLLMEKLVLALKELGLPSRHIELYKDIYETSFPLAQKEQLGANFIMAIEELLKAAAPEEVRNLIILQNRSV